MADFTIHIDEVGPYHFLPLEMELFLTPLYNVGDIIYFWIQPHTHTDTNNQKQYIITGEGFVLEKLIYGVFGAGYDPDRIRINSLNIIDNNSPKTKVKVIDSSYNEVSLPVTMSVDNGSTHRPYGLKMLDMSPSTPPVEITLSVTAFEFLSMKSVTRFVRIKFTS